MKPPLTEWAYWAIMICGCWSALVLACLFFWSVGRVVSWITGPW